VTFWGFWNGNSITPTVSVEFIT